ncbi:MAG: hypothetical protein CMN73_11055 [Sphingomonas sp.]|nr:hypothetical protein [Sphingomonas sp.]
MSEAPTPNDIIKHSDMSFYQAMVIAICVLTYAADGLDVVTLSYAAPLIIGEWGISPAAFGLVSSATPVGIAIGSIFISPLADRIGRRTLTLWLLGSLSAFLFATTACNSLILLLILRLVTGMALGALVVCLNVTVTEYSNAKRSNFFVGILHTGYSAGGMLCGALAAVLIEPYGWRSIFLAAAILNVISFVLNLAMLSESPAYLLSRRGPDALARINAVLARMGKPMLEILPPAPEEQTGKRKGSWAIIPRGLWAGTALLCFAGFVFTISGGFMAGWRPQMLAFGGLDMTWNGVAGVTTYGAGIIAHLIVGGLARRVGEGRIAVIFLLGMAASFIFLGAVPTGSTWGLVAASTLSGFFNVGSYTALILVTLNYYDVGARNAGLGIMMGFSRVGGIIGPLLGGIVIGADFGRFWVMFLFGAMMVIPAATAIFARMKAPTRTPELAHG